MTHRGQVPRRVGLFLSHGLFADALSGILERDRFEVVTADDTAELMAFTRDGGSCILDLALEGSREALEVLEEQRPDVTVIVIGAPDAFRGPSILGATPRASVAEADGLGHVLAILRGEQVRPAEARRQRRIPVERGVSRLTARESEILAGLIDGESTKALAARLGVSLATTRAHVQSVLNKLGAHTRLEAVARATQEMSEPLGTGPGRPLEA